MCEQTGGEQAMRLFVAFDRMRRALRAMPLPGNLSAAQMCTLLAIEHGGRAQPDGAPAMPVTQLAHALSQSPPSASQHVRALEALGYVRRVGAAHDRRVSALCLTPAGSAALSGAKEAVAARLDAAISALGPADTELLIALAGRFAAGLEEPPAHPAHSTLNKEPKPLC